MTATLVPPAPDGATTASTKRSGFRLRYVVVALVLLGALGFLVAKGLSSALNFYLPVNQALHQRASLDGHTFNLEGLVEPGTIHATPSGVDFTLTAGGDRVAVHNTGSPPQLFQPDIPVIAVGHFVGGGFASNQILVKHTSSYIAAHPNRVTAPNGTKR
ncbi:MAG: cytochrome c maturation protein CcmE [Actinomycetota bacterium]|nr:cytochrome c maturation protein CcmE [Actinomycetota bacterium]MDA8294651.1 cytochrome c maturation protein CcmE [Actinomycetota bacterium]